MEAKEYTIYNKTRERPITTGVTIVNSTREPLTALRVMVEGLGSDNDAGLWLTHITGLPMVPRLSPFDLVYLDKDHCVVERAELLPASEMPRFKNPAFSALILPFQTISTMKIDTGDEFEISEDQELGGAVPVAAIQATAPTAVAPVPAPVATVPVDDGVLERIAPEAAACDAESAPVPEEVEIESTAPEAAAAATEAPVTPKSEGGAPKSESWTSETAAETLYRSRSKKKKKRNRGKGNAKAKSALVAAVSRVSDAARTPVGSAAPEPTKASPLPEPAKPAVADPVAPEMQAVEESGIIPAAEEIALPAEASVPRILEAAIPEASAVEPVAEREPEEHDADSVSAAPASLVLASQAAVADDTPTLAASQTAAPAEEPSAPASSSIVVRAASTREDGHVEPARRILKLKKLETRVGPRPSAMQRAEAKSEAKIEKPESLPERGLVDRFMSWLYPSRQERRHSLRQPSPGLVAYELSGETPRMLEIGNISSTGLFLRTKEEPWEPGSVLHLTLQRSGPPEDHSEQRIELEAGAVRVGDGGVGLSFLWPTEMDLQLWERPVRTDVFETVPDYILREIRIARALAFLKRVCPPATEEARLLFYNRLSNIRVANGVEIALKAERLLVNEPNAEGLLAHPELVIRILEDGSWVDVDWIQQLWAGLLATSCTEEGQDESNLVFINLLSTFAPIHARILSAACAKATQVMAGDANSPYLLACSAEEMARLTGASNLTKIYRSIAELSDLGLLEKMAKHSSYAVSGVTRTKPTDLGMQMYARCNGKREVTTAA
jgi:PilZ domain